jgi:hypothetical protein
MRKCGVPLCAKRKKREGEAARSSVGDETAITAECRKVTGRSYRGKRLCPVWRDSLDKSSCRLPNPAICFPSRTCFARVRRSTPGGAAESGISRPCFSRLCHNLGWRRGFIGMVVGPRVTRYELQLAPGTKVAKVSALKDDWHMLLLQPKFGFLLRFQANRLW